jgi:hypothetical protein
MSSHAFCLKLAYSLLCSLVEDLLLEGSGLGEANSDLVGGQLVVAVSNGGQSVEHDFSVKWVKEDLVVLLAIGSDSGGSSGDEAWEAL